MLPQHFWHPVSLRCFNLASSCLSQFFFYNSPCLAQASSLTRLLNCTTKNTYSFKYLKLFGWVWEGVHEYGVQKCCLSLCLLFSWDQVSHWTSFYASIRWPQQPPTPSATGYSFLLGCRSSELRSSTVHRKSSYPPSFPSNPKYKDFICILSKIYPLLTFQDFPPVNIVAPKILIFAISCVLSLSL